MESSFVGIDFGTTNSAIGVAAGRSLPELVPLVGAIGGGRDPCPTWRSVLYFEPSVDSSGGDGVSIGPEAIARYLTNEGQGRLVQSIKSHLASSLFSKTRIRGRTWTLEELVGTYIRRLRACTPRELGRRAVVGRPVNYWGAKSEQDNERAVARMREALAIAGFDEVAFEYEPTAAAARYAAGLDHDELVLIADFGGGTSDFTVIRVGPAVAHAGEEEAILATGGVGIGGDTFDGAIVDRLVAPSLGKGGEYASELGARMPIPPWLYNSLRRWHQLSFLRSTKTMHLLERIESGADEPEKVARFRTLVEEDLGLPLHQAVEAAKVLLSTARRTTLAFDRAGVAIDAPLPREAFDAWVAPDLDAIDRVVADTLDRAGVATGEIDRVFSTGGSSFVPAIRQRLGATFGADRVVGGEELTSVAWGLAWRARQRYGE